MDNGKESLEETVSQQQRRIDELEQTVRKMMPSRRDTLKAGAAAGIGMLGFGAGNASAELNDGDTQWGSDSNRDDYIVDHLDANVVDTDELNTVRYAAPGNVQTALDESSAAGGGKVSLRPEADYDANGWTVPTGVVLDFNGTVIEPTTDTEVVSLVKPGAAVIMEDGGVDVRGMAYTSDVVTVDSVAAGRNYAADDGMDCTAKVRVLADQGGGAVGLRLVADGSVAGGGQHYGCTYELTQAGGDIGIAADIPNNSFINSCRMHVDITDARIGIEQTASAGTAGDFINEVTGVIQPDTSGINSQYGIVNRTNAYGPILFGTIWDSATFTQAGLDGDVSLFGANPFPTTGASYSGTMVRFINGEVQIKGSDTTGSLKPTAGEFRMLLNGNNDYTFRSSSNFAAADLINNDAGAGFVCKTPDGTSFYRIRVDNTGSVVTEPL